MSINEQNLDLIEAAAKRLEGTPLAVQKLFDVVLDLQIEMRRLTPLLHAGEGGVFDSQVRRTAEAFESLMTSSERSVGLQAGVDSTDVLLALRMAESVMSIHDAEERVERHRRCRAILRRALFED